MIDGQLAGGRVGFVVDHPQRDLPGLVALSAELAERNIECVLVPMYEQGLDIPLLQLDALVLNYARDVNLPLVREYASLGIAIFVLDTEGGVLSESGRASPQEIAHYVKTSGYAQLLSGYFFWGSTLRDMFQKKEVFPAEKLFLTGCPRFDFYQPPLLHLESAIRVGHVLVNTNFPMVNPRFGSGKGGDRAALRAVGFDDDYIEALHSANAMVMAGMIGLVQTLASDLPHKQFVLRPHPFENIEVYEEAFAASGNVTVDSAGPVLDALRGAAALLHCNCGTAIEALMLGIVPVTPQWINENFLRDHSRLPSDASQSVGNYEDLRNLLASEEPGAGFDFDQRYGATAQEFFYLADGQASRRVADVLLATVRFDKKRTAISLGASLNGSRRSPRALQRLQGVAANLVGSAAIRSLRSWLRRNRGDKSFSVAEVALAAQKIALALDRDVPQIEAARHPITGLALSSVLIAPPADRLVP